MLRLTLADHDIELYQNEPVNLSYQFSDVQNINSSASNFSQTFRVPLTGQNQEYFGAVNEIGLIPTWNPKTKVKAEISYNTVPIMRGFAQVKNIYIQKGRYADVELVVFGETADLSRDVGDGMLTDVNLSAFNHTLNAANIEASWAGTLSSGVIRYGIIDKWRNWRSGNIWTATEPLEHGDFTPYILTSKLFETILTEAGYTYDSNFFDSKVGELYMLMNRGNRLPIPVDADQPSANVFQVGLAADYSNGANTWTPIPGLSEAAPFYDAGGNVSSGAFTAPFEAFYTFRVLASGNINHTITTVSLRLSKNSSTEIFPIITNFPGAVFNEEVYVITSDPILLNSGDVVRFDTIISDNAHTLTLYGNNSLSAGGTGFSVIEITEPTSGQMVDVAAIQVEPTTDLQARTYEWTHSNGKDLVNDLVQKNASRTYGRYKVDDPENDFAAGEKRIKTAFAPHVVSYIPGTDYAIHRMLADTINADNTIKDPLPRLAFWNGLTTGVLYYLNDTSGTVTSTTYPMLSQFSASYPTVSDDDLSFGVERPFHRVQANPVNTLYYKYWMPWVNELYSSDARIVTAYFRLTASEMATFEFSDKIYIKDTYFRILSISNYDPTTENVVQVRLVKILGEIRDCYYIPVSSDKNGQISFSTPLGSIVTSPSPGCCERYGYVFDDSGLTSRCFQNLPQ